MKRVHLVILTIAALLTAYVIWHEYTYDIPSVPYTPGQYLNELVIVTPVAVAIFYSIIIACFCFFAAIYRLFRKTVNR